MDRIAHDALRNLGAESIRELESELGILASGRNESYGCIFGRDSLITAYTLLNVYQRTNETYYLALVRKILENLALLQGKEVNIESGEEPGKMIHEYRPHGHEHLTSRGSEQWYLYADAQMRNYDSADATPLFLMTTHAYLRASNDDVCIETLLPNIRAALAWISLHGDSNGDGFLDYSVHPERRYGGLATQSWMDSAESVFFEDTEERPLYPIAPVEVQAYTYTALRAWADYFLIRDTDLSLDLSRRANALKSRFNDVFVMRERRGRKTLAFAIDGHGRPLISARSSMGHCLWAAWQSEPGAIPDSILLDENIPAIARRVLAPDLYTSGAGIRTLSIRSSRYTANSYHNGSIWPHDTALIAEGLARFGFREEAARVRAALMRAYMHFNTPLELFVYDGGFREYQGKNGQGACRIQAWSAASLLSILGETSLKVNRLD